MKSLMVLRHAEAAPEGPNLPDPRRPLTARGRGQAQALGRWLATRGMVPDRILSSSAVRARETTEVVSAAADWQVAVCEVADLYTATTEFLLAEVNRQADKVQCLLVVAHAPGVPDLVGSLVARRGDVALVCEPATFMEVVFDADSWSAIALRSGMLRVLLPPHALG